MLENPNNTRIEDIINQENEVKQKKDELKKVQSDLDSDWANFKKNIPFMGKFYLRDNKKLEKELKYIKQIKENCIEIGKSMGLSEEKFENIKKNIFDCESIKKKMEMILKDDILMNRIQKRIEGGIPFSTLKEILDCEPKKEKIDGIQVLRDKGVKQVLNKELEDKKKYKDNIKEYYEYTKKISEKKESLKNKDISLSLAEKKISEIEEEIDSKKDDKEKKQLKKRKDESTKKKTEQKIEIGKLVKEIKDLEEKFSYFRMESRLKDENINSFEEYYKKKNKIDEEIKALEKSLNNLQDIMESSSGFGEETDNHFLQMKTNKRLKDENFIKEKISEIKSKYEDKINKNYQEIGKTEGKNVQKIIKNLDFWKEEIEKIRKQDDDIYLDLSSLLNKKEDLEKELKNLGLERVSKEYYIESNEIKKLREELGIKKDPNFIMGNKWSRFKEENITLDTKKITYKLKHDEFWLGIKSGWNKIKNMSKLEKGLIIGATLAISVFLIKDNKKNIENKNIENKIENNIKDEQNTALKNQNYSSKKESENSKTYIQKTEDIAPSTPTLTQKTESENSVENINEKIKEYLKNLYVENGRKIVTLKRDRIYTSKRAVNLVEDILNIKYRNDKEKKYKWEELNIDQRYKDLKERGIKDPKKVSEKKNESEVEDGGEKSTKITQFVWERKKNEEKEEVKEKNFDYRNQPYYDYENGKINNQKFISIVRDPNNGSITTEFKGRKFYFKNDWEKRQFEIIINNLK